MNRLCYYVACLNAGGALAWYGADNGSNAGILGTSALLWWLMGYVIERAKGTT